MSFDVVLSLPAKITPPEPSSFFERPELLRKLREFIAAPRKLWISAPGGAGKTTLVRACLAGEPRPFVWYQVDPGDRDPASLFFYLSQAAHSAGPGGKPLPPLSPEYLPNLPVFCRNFFREFFARFNQGCVLVFDDLQEGPGEPLLGTMLGAAMAVLPLNASLIVLSREEPYPCFARERINRSLAYLGWDDLRLSADETRCFLAWARQEEPHPPAPERAYELTQGWLAGLLLFLENPDTQRLPDELSLGRTDLLFDYFASETFDRLSAASRDFLMVCAVLPTVEAGMAEALSGQSEARGILRELVRGNHFTFRISVAPEVYRFHPLFREFLLTRVDQLDAQYLGQIRERAARLLLAAGQPEAAADLLIALKDWPLLGEQIVAQGRAFLRQGRSLTLLQWLEALPSPFRNAEPWLCYWFGRCLMDRSPARARVELARAFEGFEARGEAAGSMLAWSMVISAIVLDWDKQSELDEWITRFDRLLERYPDYPSPEIECLMVSGIVKTLLWRRPSRMDLPDWAARLYELVTTAGDIDFRLMNGSILAFYHVVGGNLSTARALVEVIDRDMHGPTVSPIHKLSWLSTRAILEWLLLDRQGCLATIAEGRAIIEAQGIHLMDLRLYGQGITLGLTTGDLPLVRRLLEELPAVPVIAALDYAHHSLLLADYSLLQGDTAKGITLAEVAVKRADEGGGIIIKCFSMAGLVLALYQGGRIEEAAEVLQASLELSRGMSYFTCYFHLLAAFFALERRDEDAVRPLLSEGFGLAARQGYLNFHPWRDEIMARLCRAALAAGIEVDYVTRLAVAHKLDIARPGMSRLTPKEIEILTWVQQGKTSWEISKILKITERTVKFHVGNILRKLGANSRSQAVAIAMREGFLKSV